MGMLKMGMLKMGNARDGNVLGRRIIGLGGGDRNERKKVKETREGKRKEELILCARIQGNQSWLRPDTWLAVIASDSGRCRPVVGDAPFRI